MSPGDFLKRTGLKHSLLQDQEVGKKPEADEENKCEII